MPTDFEDANVLLLNDPIEVEEADVDTAVNVESPDQLQRFLDQEEEQLRDKVDKIVESGADVVFCQKGIDDLAQHYLAKEGILAVRRTKKSDLTFPQERPRRAHRQRPRFAHRRRPRDRYGQP